jgi:hypothetical protein
MDEPGILHVDMDAFFVLRPEPITWAFAEMRSTER